MADDAVVPESSPFGRERSLVGRTRDIDALVASLETPRTRLVHITGPAGIGKTALALELERRVAASGRRTRRASADTIGDCDVLFVDIDDEDPVTHARSLLASAPPCVRVVLISRRSLPVGCFPDPALSDGVHAHTLSTLGADASAMLCAQLGLDDVETRAVVARAGGSPLLVAADAARQRAGARGGAQATMPLRLEGRALRDAVFASALVRHVTEPLLGAMLDAEASAVFDRLLTDVPLVQTDSGLSLPDALRDLALDELARRAPELRSTWARRAQDYLLDRIDDAALDEIPSLTADLLFACRFEPFAGDVVERGGGPLMSPAPSAEARARARAAIVAFEGEASARLFDLWHGTPWAMFLEGREHDGTLRGFVLSLVVHPDGDHPEGDPIVDALLAAIARVGGRFAPHERVCIGRFWLDYAHYQAVRPSVSAWSDMLATGAVVGASVHSDAPRWLGMAARPFGLLAQADIGETTYAAFGIDRRRERVAAPFARIVEACRTGVTRADDAVYVLATDEVAEARVDLSPDALGAPLRVAFRSLHRPDALDTSPLTRLVWVRDLVASSGARPSHALVRRLAELVDALGDEGHEAVLARTLRATYLVSPRKGNVIASELGMGYSTYRRWLRDALDRATTVLAAREDSARRTRA